MAVSERKLLLDEPGMRQADHIRELVRRDLRKTAEREAITLGPHPPRRPVNLDAGISIRRRGRVQHMVRRDRLPGVSRYSGRLIGLMLCSRLRRSGSDSTAR